MAGASGPLSGVKVLELSSERSAYAGKLFADMGADVVVVEPPGGDRMRTYEPFAADQPGPERSLFWWQYGTSKRGIVLDLDDAADRERFAALAGVADIVLESEPPGRLAALGLDYAAVSASNPRLVYISVTPFGASGPRSGELATDLTLLASGGAAWMCGYDDHELPPVRGGGNQGYHTGSHFAVMSALVALLHREATGRGQFIDVNINAAINVTTEAGSYTWLVANEVVQRQTGRHAAVTLTMPTSILCGDGRYVNTTVPPRRPAQFIAVYEWMQALRILDTFEQAEALQAAAQGEAFDVFAAGEDPAIRAKMVAGRLALNHIAAALPAYDFFVGAQERGFQVAIVYAPEETFEDPHFVARGMQVELEQGPGETYRYPGVPIRFNGSPAKVSRRAPHLGEHGDEVLAEWVHT